MADRIAVIMSTYNGEKFLSSQLDSIICQNNVLIELFVRDDGSTDNTISILEEYQNKYQNIHLIKGTNIGCIKSFLFLISYVQSYDFEYYALCDQDDVWLSNKLTTAINSLRNYNDLPALYCCNLNVVNQDLKFIKLMHPLNAVPNKGMSFVANIATGCTCVLNSKLIKLVCEITIPDQIVMHDWWIYCIAMFWGKVIFDRHAYINYRQHTDNVVGARNTNFIAKSLSFIKSCLKPTGEHYREKQAKLFLLTYGKYLSPNDIVIINRIANYRTSIYNQITLSLSRKLIKGRSIRLRIRILFGLI